MGSCQHLRCTKNSKTPVPRTRQRSRNPGSYSGAVSFVRSVPSVWEGEDPELLEQMLGSYPRKTPRRILDATANRGRFWRGSKRRVIGLDINPEFGPDVVGDNTNMHFFRDGEFDVVVYDPPHIPNLGRDNEKDFNERFGLVLKSPKENGYTFSHTFPLFSREAFRVLENEGIFVLQDCRLRYEGRLSGYGTHRREAHR